MAARAIGSGTVSFGLVSIPVKLYSTNQTSSGISFNLLHRDCGSRLKQQYICPKDDNKVVEKTDMAKGYEFAKGQYVVFSDDELKALEEQASEAIEITEFVKVEQIDPVYYDKAYYLGPDKGAERAYRLLMAAMKTTGRCALAKYSARGKQYLVLVRPGDGVMVMQQLRYADEVKTADEVPVETGDVKDHELKLAVQLVEQISSDEFHPEKYEDDVKKRTMELIQKKVDGQEITSAPEEAPQAKIIDLMEALKASLAERSHEASSAGAGGGDGEARKPPKRAPAGESAKVAKSEPAADKKAPKKAKAK